MDFDLWEVAFWVMWAMWAYMAYAHYLKPIITKIQAGTMYLTYHNIITGESINRTWTEGVNIIKGKPRMFVEELVSNGVLYYDGDNIEPLTLERILVYNGMPKYIYYCSTKNFDTVNRQDLLETLMILSVKDKIIAFLIVVGLIVFAFGAINLYMIYSVGNDINGHVAALNTAIQATKNASIAITGHN